VCQEAETRTSDLSDHHPAIVSRVIFFLYTGNFDPGEIPEIFRARCADIESPSDPDGKQTKRDSDGNLVAIRRRDVSTQHLKVNSMVYKLADMLGYEYLKIRAFFRCERCLCKAFLDAGFPSGLKTLFECTREEDELRVRTMIFLARKNLDGELRKQAFAVLMEYEPRLWKLCRQVLEEYQKTEEDINIARSEETVAKLEGLGLRCKHGKAVRFTPPEANEHYTLFEVRKAEKWVVVEFDCDRCRHDKKYDDESDECELP
jgi:hypothetical protein